MFSSDIHKRIRRRVIAGVRLEIVFPECFIKRLFSTTEIPSARKITCDVEWLSLGTHNTGVVSSNPTPVTIEKPLVRKATGNHRIKSFFLGKNAEPYLRFLPRAK